MHFPKISCVKRKCEMHDFKPLSTQLYRIYFLRAPKQFITKKEPITFSVKSKPCF